MLYNEGSLRFKEITCRPEKAQKEALVLIPKKKSKYVPPFDHPWRKFKFSKQAIQNNNFQTCAKIYRLQAESLFSQIKNPIKSGSLFALKKEFYFLLLAVLFAVFFLATISTKSAFVI